MQIAESGEGTQSPERVCISLEFYALSLTNLVLQLTTDLDKISLQEYYINSRTELHLDPGSAAAGRLPRALPLGARLPGRANRGGARRRRPPRAILRAGVAGAGANDPEEASALTRCLGARR